MQTATKAAAPSAKGCFRCGGKDHWAKDCSAPPSEWINKQPGGAGAQDPAAAAGAKGAALQEGQVGLTGKNNPTGAGEHAGAPKAGQSNKRKRPKVTLELLQGEAGIPDVFYNFPSVFRKQFKGKGHEAGDLRRLLEMYKRWQERIFPSAPFDTFIQNVEKLSGTNLLKHELRQMRTKLVLEVAQDAMRPPPPPVDEDKEGAGPGEGNLVGSMEAGPAADFDDLLALGDFEDDDMVGMLEEELQPLGQAAGPGTEQGGAVAGQEEEEVYPELDIGDAEWEAGEEEEPMLALDDEDEEALAEDHCDGQQGAQHEAAAVGGPAPGGAGAEGGAGLVPVEEGEQPDGSQSDEAAAAVAFQNEEPRRDALVAAAAAGGGEPNVEGKAGEQAQGSPAAAAAGHSHSNMVGAVEHGEIDDDALLALALEEGGSQGGSQGPPAAPSRPASDVDPSQELPTAAQQGEAGRQQEKIVGPEQEALVPPRVAAVAAVATGSGPALLLGTEASGVGPAERALVGLGTAEVMQEAYRQVAALHATEAQYEEEDEELIRLAQETQG